MINFLEKPFKDEDIFSILHPVVKEWFQGKFKGFSEPQQFAVLPIHYKKNILVSAATGSGKTLTGFLSILNELMLLSEYGLLENKCYCIYLSPLKALNNDIKKNLEEPLAEMKNIAKDSKFDFDIRVGIRTGDTTAYEKSKMLVKAPHILITTPESLALVLASFKFREHFKDVQYVIVDELHALADNKRGVHLSLSLERLQHFCSKELVRIGLGATVEPIERIAEFLVGGGRDCIIARVDVTKKMDLKVITPVKDLINVSYDALQKELYMLLDQLIQEHTTTLIFTNTRSGTERVVDHLKEKFPKKYTEVIGAHHGSLGKEARFDLEKRMREGKLKVVVSSTSLELGIDIGYIDLVILLGSPKSVSRAMQRCLPYEAKILTAQGEYLPIGEIVEKKLDVKVISYDVKGGYIPNSIAQYHKNNDSQFVHISLKCGEEIICTLEHPILTKDGWKNAGEITSSDKIGEIDSKIEFESKVPYFYELLPAEKVFVVNRDNFFQKQIDSFRAKNKLNLRTFSKISGIPYGRLVDCRRLRGRRKSIRLDYFLRVCELCELKMEEYLDYLSWLKSSGHFRMKLASKPDEDFLWLTGIMATDGCIVKSSPKNSLEPYYKIKIGNTSQVLIEKSKQILNSYGFKCNLPHKDNFYNLECGSHVLAYILMQLGIKCKNKTQTVEVGKDIYSMDSRLIHAYLEGIFEGDGNFNTNLRIFSASREFIYGLHRLCRRLGYHNLITKAKSKPSKKIVKVSDIYIYCLTITRKDDVKKFFSSIPRFGEKAQKSYVIVKDWKIVKQQLAQFTKDIYWSDIVSLERVHREQNVYNLTLKNESNNFIVDNTIVHNCGRAGHRLHETVKGRFIVTDRDDLVECSVILKNILERRIDRIHIPELCLDVLAQQIIGIAISDQIYIDELFSMVKKSYCYRNLGRSDLLEVLAYLSGEFIDLQERHVYAKIWYDKETGMIGKKGKMTRIIHMTNIGTIPDESFIIVKVGTQTIGHIDEGFLERLKRGDVFVLGGHRYEFLFSRGMVAQVKAALKQPTIPSWFSEMLPLSFDLSIEIGKFRRLMEEMFKARYSEEKIKEFIKEYLYIDENSCDALYMYFLQQYKYVKEIPNDKKIVIEYYRDEKKLYIVFHSLYGRRVNDVLSRVLGYVLGRIYHRDVELGISDNGFYLSSGKEIQVVKALGLVKSSELRESAKGAIEKSEILKRRFRHCATRALMILRQYKGKRKAVGRQQVSSMILLSAVRRIDENFFILKEARREVLEDLMDIEHAELIFKGIESKEISLKEIHTNIPSPFAFNLVLEGQSDVLKIEEKMEFLRRMHEKVIAKISLKKDLAVG